MNKMVLEYIFGHKFQVLRFKPGNEGGVVELRGEGGTREADTKDGSFQVALNEWSDTRKGLSIDGIL